MRIEQVRVCGFGTLRDARLHLPADRAGLIVAPNEAGKSTLLAAIETALYGFPSRRTDAGRQLREACRPWSGGASWIELRISRGGRRYVIRYDVRDASGGEIERWTVSCDGQDATDAMQREAGSPGQWLTGLSRDDFARTALVHQGELDAVARDPGQLRQQLERIVTSSASGGSAEQALRLLSEALDEYRERAGLESLAGDVLERARQWPRVRTRLRERLEALQHERDALEQQHSTFEAAIKQMHQQQTRIGALRIVHEVLECVHDQAVALRLRQQLDADEQTRRRLAELDAKLAEYADVEAFDTARVGEVAGLLGRYREQLEQFDKDQQALRQLAEQIRGIEEQIHRYAALDPLLPLDEELSKSLTLLKQAEQDARTIREQELEPLEQDLAEEGIEPEAIQRAYDRLHQLPGDVRRFLREYEPNRKSAAALLRTHDETAAVADERVQAIQRGQRRRRRLAVACGVAAVLLAAGVWLGWKWGASPAVLASLAGGILIAGGGLAGWLAIAAQRYSAGELAQAIRRRDAHRSEAQQLREQLEHNDRRLAELAGELGLDAQTLLAEADLVETHRDAAEKLRDVRFRLELARGAFERQVARWRQWLASAGREAPEPLTIQAAEALLGDVQGLAKLRERRDDTLEQLERQQKELADRRAELRETYVAVGRLLHEVAQIELPPASGPADAESDDGLLSLDELTQVERAFDDRGQRAAQRERLSQTRRELSAKLLDEPQREQLGRKLEQIDATPLPRFAALTSDAGLPPFPELPGANDGEARDAWAAALLDWLKALPADVRADVDVHGWQLDALEPQAVIDARRHVQQQSDELQQQLAQQSQQARAFLSEYARRMPEIDAELNQLKTELHRGEQFAKAIDLASGTLRSVQQRSHERWAAELAAALRPRLAQLLGDYALESIEDDLSLVLRHHATGTRLDAAAIRRHLSRGAQDRLFLAVRLALAEVLTGDAGPRLPLLLDDVLANCDDARFAEALAVLAELARAGWCVLLLTCQQSRADSLMPAEAAGLWQRVDGLQVVTADAADLVPPARGQQAAV